MTTSSAPPLPGFRLERLEVRNWGTFHDKVHVLDPACLSALLIGENGSGKSTLADAFLTLFVPHVKRTYNLASGDAKKRERNEKTYILGAYGSQSSQEEAKADTKFLRNPGDPPSLLLAVFHNPARDQWISLSQILWIQDTQVKKLHLIARRACTILGDLVALGEAKGWRKTLKQRGFEVEEHFSNYGEKVVKYLRMASDTTLTLFNQTVAIKEITSVSEFIRNHMLERLDARELVEHLEKHYRDLRECWSAIDRARRQLRLLGPVAEIGVELRRVEAAIARATRWNRALPRLFAHRLLVLINAELVVVEREIQRIEGEIENVSREQGRLVEDVGILERAVEDDAVGRELNRITNELQQAAAELKTRRAIAADYQAALAALGLIEEAVDPASFAERRDWALQEQTRQAQIHGDLVGQVALAGVRLGEQNERKEKISDELRSLRTRKDLIPVDDRQMRVHVARGAGVDVADLPFAGELMQVKARYALEWRGALERLLRGFGLSLLVPDRLYSEVTRFINHHHLNGRVRYHRVPSAVSLPQGGHDDRRVIEKMDLKQDHGFAPWIEAEIRRSFNYRCCETVEEFERSTGFAITKTGLRRGAGTLHEKDDRKQINDAKDHILGWSNADKILRLEEDERNLGRDITGATAQLTTLAGDSDVALKRQQRAGELRAFRSFDEVDWRSVAAKIERLERRKTEIEESSESLREMKRQLDQKKEELGHVQTRRDNMNRDKGKQETARTSLTGRSREERERLAEGPEDDLPEFYEAFERLLSEMPVTIETAAGYLRKAQVLAEIEHRGCSEERERISTSLRSAMGRFLKEFTDLAADLAAETRYLEEFLSLKQTIEQDDLPQHEERFHRLMSQDVLNHVVKFQTDLDNHSDEIQSKVSHLNEALREIEYSSKTYIRIRATPTGDAEVKDFRARLKSCLEFGLSPTDASRESAFLRISELLGMLREKAEWMSKVTDTRNWLAFGVAEIDGKTDQEVNYYVDSGGKSGGQKAKLAFTILAAAIAYQYGIAAERGAIDSFRFVVVDEMFSRSDETNSRYALELFKKFNLQLLIVSPFDARARVVEPYVASYHLAVNPTTAASLVRTVRLDEIRDRIEETPRPAHAHA